MKDPVYTNLSKGKLVKKFQHGFLRDRSRDTRIGHLTENYVLPYFEREAATLIFLVEHNYFCPSTLLAMGFYPIGIKIY